MKVNVNDILFPRIKKEDYIRCKNRGMTDKNIADCYDKALESVQSNAVRWGMRAPKFKRNRGKCHE